MRISDWSSDVCSSDLPALARSAHKLAGGLRLPNDETGDCRLFTRRLALLAAGLGVEFRYGQDVQGLQARGGEIRGVQVGGDTLTADRYVAAFGSYTRGFLAPLGLDLPVYPVTGYSLTIPLARAEAAPVSTVLDETYKVAVTRFDNRIRVGGMAELAGFDLRLTLARPRPPEHLANDLYPGCGPVATRERRR